LYGLQTPSEPYAGLQGKLSGCQFAVCSKTSNHTYIQTHIQSFTTHNNAYTDV